MMTPTPWLLFLFIHATTDPHLSHPKDLEDIWQVTGHMINCEVNHIGMKILNPYCSPHNSACWHA